MGIFKNRRAWFAAALAAIAIALSLYWFQSPPTEGDWQEHLAVQPSAEFAGDQVTIRNVRNFRYGPTEADMHPAYYDGTYDLAKLSRVWYVTEPFKGKEYAAHTFLSFEFDDGKFVSVTIEARKTEGQAYSIWKGLVRTYPLIYIAADERDVVMLRANLRKDDVYVYPVRTTPEKARELFVDMLERMNEMREEPVWYHTLFANCTSSIVRHVNRVTPDRAPFLNWHLWLTGHADKLALDLGLIDTELPLEEARAKFRVNERSEEIGDAENYSSYIRDF